MNTIDKSSFILPQQQQQKTNKNKKSNNSGGQHYYHVIPSKIDQNMSNTSQIYNNLTSNIVKSCQPYRQLHFVLNLSDNSNDGYGFVVAGNCPCYVKSVEDGSIAKQMGLKRGDLIISINNVNCCRATIKSVLLLIKQTSQKGSNFNGRMDIVIERKIKTSSKSQLKKDNNNNNIKTQGVKRAAVPQVASRRRHFMSKIFNFKPSSLWSLNCASSASSSKHHITITDLEKTVYSKKAQISKCDETLKCLNKKPSSSSTTTTTTTASSSTSSSSQIGGDTGYETISHHHNNIATENNGSDNDDFTINTVTDTINSYSYCGDVTVESNNLKVNTNKESAQIPKEQIEQFNEGRTQLIGQLLEIEADFVDYLSAGVSTFSRPLRGFFLQQQDYFHLFQNIEKVIYLSFRVCFIH
jgi:hypothetical protein